MWVRLVSTLLLTNQRPLFSPLTNHSSAAAGQSAPRALPPLLLPAQTRHPPHLTRPATLAKCAPRPEHLKPIQVINAEDNEEMTSLSKNPILKPGCLDLSLLRIILCFSMKSL